MSRLRELDQPHVNAGIEQDECRQGERDERGAQHDEDVSRLARNPRMQSEIRPEHARLTSASDCETSGNDVESQGDHDCHEHSRLEPQIGSKPLERPSRQNVLIGRRLTGHVCRQGSADQDDRDERE